MTKMLRRTHRMNQFLAFTNAVDQNFLKPVGSVVSRHHRRVYSVARPFAFEDLSGGSADFIVIVIEEYWLFGDIVRRKDRIRCDELCLLVRFFDIFGAVSIEVLSPQRAGGDSHRLLLVCGCKC